MEKNQRTEALAPAQQSEKSSDFLFAGQYDDLYISVQDYDSHNPDNEFADTLFFNHRTLDEVQVILRLALSEGYQVTIGIHGARGAHG